MKFKHVVASLSLAMFTAFGVAAGLSVKKEAKEVKADEPDTWMVRFQLDLGECSPNYDPCCFPEEKPVEGVRFHYWGTNVDETVQASYMYDSFTFAYYGVNVCLNDSQTINGAQWVLEQKDDGLKYSVNITKFGSEEVTSLNKDTTLFGLQHQFDNIWDGDHWNFSNEVGHKTDSIQLDAGVDEHIYYDFVKEPSLGRFSCKNVTFDKVTGMSLVVDKLSAFSIDDDTRGMMDEKSLQYADGDQPNWWWNAAGTFDYFLYNGTFQIRKYGIEESYIYFVSQSDADDSGLYAYTYGGSETFGAWPGTAVTEQTLDGLVEVDLRNGLHFQGQEHKVFRIPVDMSYPSGADHIIFHNGSDETKSIEFELVAGAAYWHTAPAAVKRAGVVLDILYDLQLTLKNSGSYDYGGIDLNNSVCAISTSDATRLYEAYDDLSEDEKVSYIDASWVRTYTGSGASLGWRTLTEVFVELGKRAGIISSSSSYFSADMNNGSIAVIVICVTTASALALTLLLVFKKRKHE